MNSIPNRLNRMIDNNWRHTKYSKNCTINLIVIGAENYFESKSIYNKIL